MPAPALCYDQEARHSGDIVLPRPLRSAAKQVRIVSLIILLICNIVFIVSLPVSLFLAVGSHGPFFEGPALIAAWSFPMLIPIAIIGSWILYRQRLYGRAIAFIFLPVLSIVAFQVLHICNAI